MSTTDVRQLSDGQNKAVSISSEVLVSVIIFFFVLVVLAFFLYMYTRARRGRVSDAYRSPARLVSGPDQDPAVVPAGGLDPAVVRCLPVSVYRAADFKEGIECAVCLSELVDGEKARLLPKCGHGFHLDCIDMWFHSHSTCPVCRSPVGPQATIEADDGGAPSAISTDGFSTESPRLPTNVLFWGNQDQVRAGGGGGSPAGGGLQEAPSLSSSPASSSSSPANLKAMMMIDIQRQAAEGLPLSSLPLGWHPTEEKSPTAVATMTPPSTRLRSFRRLLSREKKAVGSPCGACGGDIERGTTGNGGE